MSQLYGLVIRFPVDVFILSDIFDLIMGVLLCFFAKKENIKYLISVLGIYWGMVFGGVFGAWIEQENVYVLYLCVLVGVFMVAVILKLSENGYKFVLGMVFGFKVVYMLGAMLLEMINSERPDSVDERNCFIAALFVCALSGAFMSCLKEKFENIQGGICAFVGATQIVGILAWDPGSVFIVSGEWNHFFIPLLKVIFYDDMGLCTGLIFLVAGSGFLVQIRRNRPIKMK